MEKVTTENPHRFSRREVLRAALTAAAAIGVSQFASSKSQGLEKESVAPMVPVYLQLAQRGFYHLSI